MQQVTDGTSYVVVSVLLHCSAMTQRLPDAKYSLLCIRSAARWHGWIGLLAISDEKYSDNCQIILGDNGAK